LRALAVGAFLASEQRNIGLLPGLMCKDKPPMSTFEAVIAFIIIGLLVVWFCIYLWRDIRDRSER
jgi:predicted permease